MHATLLQHLLSELVHPVVRDLAWVLLAPPLTQPPALQRHPLAASRWLRSPEELTTWLLEQQHDPARLERWLAAAPVRRLGLYYERLWQFALNDAPDVTLLTANLPVRRGRQTLGELDLVLEDAEGIHHLELAVKLYLGLPGPDATAIQWVGPNAEDRLDLKLARLHAHQLRLPQTPEAQALLASMGIGQPQSHYWLGGYLFSDWAEQPAAPLAGVAPVHGHWLRSCQWPCFAEGPGSTLRWQPLERHRWLAPCRTEQPWDEWELAEWLHGASAQHSPRLLAGLRVTPDGHWEEVQRVFWVPDGWPAATS